VTSEDAGGGAMLGPTRSVQVAVPAGEGAGRIRSAGVHDAAGELAASVRTSARQAATTTGRVTFTFLIALAATPLRSTRDARKSAG
jgi:hypothetical protein